MAMVDADSFRRTTTSSEDRMVSGSSRMRITTSVTRSETTRRAFLVSEISLPACQYAPSYSTPITGP